jgi:hypothetical protein
MKILFIFAFLIVTKIYKYSFSALLLRNKNAKIMKYYQQK